MTPKARTSKLWDYGWLHRDTLTLRPAATEEELIGHYCEDPSFHLSFLPSDQTETGLHGPFVAERIVPTDFEPLAKSALPRCVATIRIANNPADDLVAQIGILKALQEMHGSAERCFALKYTEKSEEVFHDWGSVFFVFRNFSSRTADREQ